MRDGREEEAMVRMRSSEEAEELLVARNGADDAERAAMRDLADASDEERHSMQGRVDVVTQDWLLRAQ